MEHGQKTWKCFFSLKLRHTACDCQLKNTGRGRHRSVAEKTYCNCKKTGHIAQNCSKKSGTFDRGVGRFSTEIVTISNTSPTMYLRDVKSVE